MAEGKQAPAARAIGGKHKRRGRRPISQRARARGVNVKPMRGRPMRHERAVTREGHALAEGRTSPRMSRQKSGPTSHAIAVEGSRTTARQRRTRRTLGASAGSAPPTHNPPSHARSKRRGARRAGAGRKHA
jgi:hypothetical protein